MRALLSVLACAAGLGCVAAPATEAPQTAGTSPSASIPLLHGVSNPLEVPADLDLSQRRFSEARHFVVSLQRMGSAPPLNQMHNWAVTVETPDGRPVENATIELSGGMPAHDHGFPTTPRVTGSIGPGTYLIEGVKFSMRGWWHFEFLVRAGALEDRAHFDLVVSE